jgi:UDPglucose 6-dehydrogenase
MKINNITCIGAGYVGGPTMAMIAAKCPEIQVTVLDLNQERVDAWNSGQPPIYEPGLEDLVKESLKRNLTFSTDIKAGIEAADMIFLAVNTPTKDFGEGAGSACDLQYFEKAVRSIKRYANGDKIIVEKSTIPVKTAQTVMNILNDSPYVFSVLSNPEFLAEGTAIKDLENPDRMLIGGDKEAAQALVSVYARWVPIDRLITTNLWSSELAKLTANAFLAQRVSSINAISALCEKTGADVEEIAKAIGTDSRIGSKFLKASVGFGGSCFTKDVRNLIYLCRYFNCEEAGDYWEQVIKMNEWQKERFTKNIVKTMFGTITGKKIAIFGYAYKANTGDTRETPALNVVRSLRNENANVWITDPKALPECTHDMQANGYTFETHYTEGDFDMMQFNPSAPYDNVHLCDDIYTTAENAHAIVVCTDWKEYKDLDWQRIYDNMEKPAFVFDGRMMLDHDELREIGFEVYCIGK